MVFCCSVLFVFVFCCILCCTVVVLFFAFFCVVLLHCVDVIGRCVVLWFCFVFCVV